MRLAGTSGVVVNAQWPALVGVGLEADLHGAFANFHGVNTLVMVQFQATNSDSLKEDLGIATHNRLSP